MFISASNIGQLDFLSLFCFSSTAVRMQMEKRWQSPVMKRLVRHSSLQQDLHIENHLGSSFVMDKYFFHLNLHTHSPNMKEIQTNLSHNGLGIGTFH